MSTPVLTKRQLKHSLSAKKTPVKGLRNVLARPHDIYWPLIDDEKCSIVEDILKKLAPIMRRPVSSIPWSRLRHMKREERVLAKEDAISKQKNTFDKKILSSLVVGINAVTRSLERNQVCCVLVDANVDPPLLIRHIILMAQNQKLPVLLLPSLKSLTLNTIGFTTAAFALKNTVAESSDHDLHKLYQSIVNIFKEIPPPKRSLQLFKDESLDDSICKDTTKVNVEMKTETSEPEKFTLSTDVYKYRSSRTERAFLPLNATQTPVVQKMECEDFISIAKYDSESIKDTIARPKNSRYVNLREEQDTGHKVKKAFRSTNAQYNERRKMKENNYHRTKSNNSTDVKYLSLKVKRLQGNNNRAKATKISKQKKK